MKAVLLIPLVLLIGSMIIEISLRLVFGFGNPPLYIADDDIGYLLAPNQTVRRFGNLIATNQYSMRSPMIEPCRPANTLRIFLVGDSIVNGNWWTDQSETLSTQIQQALAKRVTDQTIEVINASANSWGPRNELAYLQKFGTFDAQIVMLVINTDDLFGTQPSPLQVGKDRSYPSQKPPLALFELINRFQKQAPIPGLKELQNEPGDRVGKNLTAIHAIQTQVEENRGQLLLAMTPLKREVLNGPRDYELTARKRVDTLTNQHTIPYLNFLPLFQEHPNPESLYRDHIHLSPEGNSLVTESLRDLMLRSLPSYQQTF